MNPELLACVDALSSPNTSAEDRSRHKSVLLSIVPSQVRFTELLRGMGTYLTHTETHIRRLSTLLLADTLACAKGLKLTAAEATHVCQFFCRRLADYPSVGPCLKALTAFARHHADVLEAECAPRVAKQVFKAVHVPAMEQQLRMAVFRLFELLMSIPKYEGRIRQCCFVTGDISSSMCGG